jgi:hypothetical protein
MMRAVFIATVAGILAACESFSLRPAQLATPPEYPIVFSSQKQMVPLGLVLKDYGDIELDHSCYWFGEVEPTISISRELLERYRRRGFSLNSLCMALQSPLAFNPESGEKLPNYTIIEAKCVSQKQRAVKRLTRLDERNPSSLEQRDRLYQFIMTSSCASADPLPLAVPDCYSRGLPLHDCQFQYHPATGKPLSDREQQYIAAQRKALERFLADVRTKGHFQEECSCKTDPYCCTHCWPPRRCKSSSGKTCRNERELNCISGEVNQSFRRSLAFESVVYDYHDQLIDYEAFADDMSLDTMWPLTIGLVDVSPTLPLGYGYALDIPQEAGPGGGDESLASNEAHRFTEAHFEAVRRVMYEEKPGRSKKTRRDDEGATVLYRKRGTREL